MRKNPESFIHRALDTITAPVRLAWGDVLEKDAVYHTVKFPRKTFSRLGETAEITGRETVTEVIKDSLSVHDWMLSEQAQGKTVAALTDREISLLQLDENRKITSFIKPDKLAKAKEIFQSPTSEENQP